VTTDVPIAVRVTVAVAVPVVVCVPVPVVVSVTIPVWVTVTVSLIVGGMGAAAARGATPPSTTNWALIRAWGRSRPKPVSRFTRWQPSA